MKPIGSSNVAIAEIHLDSGIAFCAGATASNKYADRNLDLLSKLPDDLRIKLDEVSHRSYSELYELVINEEVLLKDSLEEILELLEDVNPAANINRLLDSIAEYQSGKLVPQSIEELRQELGIGG